MSPGFNLKDTVVEALTALGGSGTAPEVRKYIKSKYGKDWKEIEKILDDLCQESASSFFLPEDRVLTKIGHGKYALKETVAPILPEPEVESKKAMPGFGLGRTVFSFRGAEELLRRKGQLSTILQAASLTNLSSLDEHDKIQHFFHKNMWDVEVSLFPVATYKLDAFKEKTAIEIERSLIDAVHKSLFRCLWAYNKNQLDVLVFIVPTYKEPRFEQVKRDLQEFKEIIPFPVYLVGVPILRPKQG
jgi:hemerythrin